MIHDPPKYQPGDRVLVRHPTDRIRGPVPGTVTVLHDSIVDLGYFYVVKLDKYIDDEYYSIDSACYEPYQTKRINCTEEQLTPLTPLAEVLYND